MEIGLELERSSIVDILTVFTFGIDTWLLYNEAIWNQSQVFSISTDIKVIAIQLTFLMIVVYVVEFLFDKMSSGGGHH